jgi:uncharacterized phiE125 gp8 family phage protein
MLQRIAYTAGSQEPVSVDEARAACRLDDAELDLDLLLSIQQAREQAEVLTGRCYRGQRLRDEFVGWPAGATLCLPVHEATAVEIRYRSAAQPDDWTLLDASQYRWSSQRADTRIDRRSTVASWPELATPDYGSRVRVEVTAGPAADATLPASVRRFILAHVAAWVELPAALRAGGAVAVNPLAERLLDGERLWR